MRIDTHYRRIDGYERMVIQWRGVKGDSIQEGIQMMVSKLKEMIPDGHVIDQDHFSIKNWENQAKIEISFKTKPKP